MTDFSEVPEDSLKAEEIIDLTNTIDPLLTSVLYDVEVKDENSGHIFKAFVSH